MTQNQPADPRIELAWTLAQSGLQAQVAAVDELRARVGSPLAAAAIATGFLSSQSLSDSTGLPAGAWLAIGSSLALMLSCAYILSPQEWAGAYASGQTVLDYTRSQPTVSLNAIHSQLTTFAGEQLSRNATKLTRLYRTYVAALVFLVTDFAGWFWTLSTH
jgi:hypothetical protein